MVRRWPEAVARLAKAAPVVLTVATCAMVLTVSWERSAVAADIAAKVKAEYVERFCRFVKWPASAPGGEAFVIGVLGTHPVEEALREISTRTRIGGKPVEVRRISDAGKVAGCRVVFVAADGADQLEAVIRAARGSAVLTVADSPGFADRGVMVNFKIVGEFIRFEINPGEARAAGLEIDDKLISLGEVVS